MSDDQQLLPYQTFRVFRKSAPTKVKTSMKCLRPDLGASVADERALHPYRPLLPATGPRFATASRGEHSHERAREHDDRHGGSRAQRDERRDAQHRRHDAPVERPRETEGHEKQKTDEGEQGSP